MEQQDDFDFAAEASQRYMQECLQTFARAIDAEFLTDRAAISVLMAVAILIARGRMGADRGAEFLQTQVQSLTDHMRSTPRTRYDA